MTSCGFAGCARPRRRNGIGKFGYGHYGGSKGRVKAHRYSYMLAHGLDRLPDGMMVCHRCDNPPCVRPDHLFLGTASDNSRDREAKGRGAPLARGEDVVFAKLTEHDVVDIRTLRAFGARVKDLADGFSVDPMTVSRVVNRRIWRHVP